MKLNHKHHHEQKFLEYTITFLLMKELFNCVSLCEVNWKGGEGEEGRGRGREGGERNVQ